MKVKMHAECPALRTGNGGFTYECDQVQSTHDLKWVQPLWLEHEHTCTFDTSLRYTKMAEYVCLVRHCTNVFVFSPSHFLCTSLITSIFDSVSVDVSSFSFKYYHGGIYVDDSCSNKKLNHAMLLVGYGTSGEQDYWIVKNR